MHPMQVIYGIRLDLACFVFGYIEHYCLPFCFMFEEVYLARRVYIERIVYVHLWRLYLPHILDLEEANPSHLLMFDIIVSHHPIAVLRFVLFINFCFFGNFLDDASKQKLELYDEQRSSWFESTHTFVRGVFVLRL